MASRYYLPASGTATVSPTFSAEWLHANTLRRPMTSPKGSTALSSTAASYNPDAADHLVNGDALAIQYISDPIGTQTLTAQTIKLAVQVREVNAANNLFLAWKLWIWKADNTVGPTLVPLHRQGGAELTTTNASRFDSVTSTAASVGNGDRLVLELGYGGLPIAAAGNGRHNGGFRLGENGTSDLLETDGASGITENPWLELAANLVPYDPNPTPSVFVAVRGTTYTQSSVARATTGVVAARAALRIGQPTVAPTVVVTDTFNRPDNAVSLGTADTGQVWSALAGTWGISGNGAVQVSGAGHRLAVLESGLSDVTIQVTLSPTDFGQSSFVGIAVRAQDTSNYLVFYVRPDQAICRLASVVGGSLTTLATGDLFGPASSVLRVECSGTTVSGYVDGVLAAQATGVTSFLTATKHGLYAFLPETTVWNDFLVQGAPPPAIPSGVKASFAPVAGRVQARQAVLAAPKAAVTTVEARGVAQLATGGLRETSSSASILTTSLSVSQVAPRAAHAAAFLRAHAFTELTVVSEFIYWWPPSERLKPVHLGYAYRGDTLILPIWQAIDQRGNLLSLEGATVWFTAKADLADTDADPLTIQCSTVDGGVVIIDAALGSYQVTVPADETQQLDDDTRFTFDVQVVTAIPTTHTVRRGTLIVVRDITRSVA